MHEFNHPIHPPLLKDNELSELLTTDEIDEFIRNNKIAVAKDTRNRLSQTIYVVPFQKILRYIIENTEAEALAIISYYNCQRKRRKRKERAHTILKYTRDQLDLPPERKREYSVKALFVPVDQAKEVLCRFFKNSTVHK